MQPKDMLTNWENAPEPPRLYNKQLSIRLPVLLAARINALSELFPGKNKTDIVTDLLTAALAHLEAEMPSKMGEMVGTRTVPTPEAFFSCEKTINVHRDIGLKGIYRATVIKNLRAIEAEMKITDPMVVPEPVMDEIEED